MHFLLIIFCLYYCYRNIVVVIECNSVLLVDIVNYYVNKIQFIKQTNKENSVVKLSVILVQL